MVLTIFQPMWNFQSFRGFPHLYFKLDASTSQALAEFHEEGGVEARKARYQVPFWGPCEKVGDVQTDVVVSLNGGFSLQIIDFNVFHEFPPSFWGNYFWVHTHVLS